MKRSHPKSSRFGEGWTRKVRKLGVEDMNMAWYTQSKNSQDENDFLE